MKIEFTVAGEPQGKQRPRFAKRGQYISVRTPEKTKDYEENIWAAFWEQCGNVTFPEGSQLELRVLAFFKIPKSTSKRKQAAMLSGEIRPTKKPDIDNILKAVADALNGVCYKDDSCIVKMSGEKFYSDKPRIVVILKICENEIVKKG